jgi:hypothetical protein
VGERLMTEDGSDPEPENQHGGAAFGPDLELLARRDGQLSRRPGGR